MIKAITLITRKKGLSVADFQDYWQHRHVDVIRKLPGIRCYVQNHPLPDNYKQGEPVCDGVAELWGDDTDVFRSMAASDAYPAVLADEDAFIDRRATQLILADEAVLLDGQLRDGAVKIIGFHRRRPGMQVEEFQRYWRDVHGLQVRRLPGLRRYVQSPARIGGYSARRSPAYDGLSAMWFDSGEDVQHALQSAVQASLQEDRENFLAGCNEPILACREYLIIA